VKKENRYKKKTKMTEIRLYTYKVIEMDIIRGDWCVWKIKKCACDI